MEEKDGIALKIIANGGADGKLRMGLKESVICGSGTRAAHFVGETLTRICQQQLGADARFCVFKAAFARSTSLYSATLFAIWSSPL